MNDTSADTFPGWYPDPKNQADQRFWNGRDWTSQTRSAVPAAEFVPVMAERAPTTGSAAGLSQADSENGTDMRHDERNGQGRVRIFGGSTSGPGPANGEANDVEPNRVEAVADAEPRAGGLFSDTAKAASAAKSARDEEAEALAASIDHDTELQAAAVTQPTVTPLATAPSQSVLSKLLLAALPALLIGGLIGWFIGQNRDDPDPDPDSGAVLASADDDADGSSTDASLDTDVSADTTVPESTPTSADSGDVAALEQQVDDLSNELDEVTAQVDALTIERDNVLEHNDILQTWFTPEVRNNAEATWNNEVQRACDAEAEPTLENTNYTRRMELMGTHADLVTAALVCRAEG